MMINGTKAKGWAIGLMISLMAINAGSAIAFHNSIETLDDLKPGKNSFSAHAGDVIMVRSQSSDGNTNCDPQVESTEDLQYLNQVDRHLYDQASIWQVHQDGTYNYWLPLEFDETGSCSITVGALTRYEQLVIDAEALEGQSASFSEALALYQQAIALEPQYPDTYYGVLGLLFNKHFSESDADVQTIEEAGALFLSWPETTRTLLISQLNTLAAIYETSPEWQGTIADDPDMLREFAEFIRTGQSADSLAPLLYLGIQENSDG